MQKIIKILRVDSEKKMLLKNGLTDNTEFIGPFPLGIQFNSFNTAGLNLRSTGHMM